MIEDFIEECREFINIPSVSYFEKPFMDFILKKIPRNNYRIEANQNFIACIPKKKKPKLSFSVHIDRLGIVYNGVNFVYSNYYGYRIKKKEYSPSVIFGKRFVGKDVIAYDLKGEIIGEGIVKNCKIKEEVNDLVFDIDGIDLDKLNAPTPIAYKSNLLVTENEIIGQIDNVINVVLAYFLLKNKANCSVFFTTKEETGDSWPFILNILKKHKIKDIVILDTTKLDNKDYNSNDLVFRISDDLTEYNRDLIDNFIKLAEKKNIDFYIKTKKPDGAKIKNITELGHIVKESDGEYSGATIQLPVINYHTQNETVKKKSLERTYLFIKNILDNL